MNETQLSNVQVGKSTPWLAAGAVIVIAGLLGLAKYQGWPIQFHCDYAVNPSKSPYWLMVCTASSASLR